MVLSQISQFLLALPFALLRVQLPAKLDQRKVLFPRFCWREFARVPGAVSQLGLVPPPMLFVGSTVQIFV